MLFALRFNILANCYLPLNMGVSFTWDIMKYYTLLLLVFIAIGGCKSTENEIKFVPYVKLSFVISEEGKPTNIIVLDAQPDSSNDSKAITALSKWVYKPKIVDGVAVAQDNITVQLEF